jgi:hypothetical protein
MKKFLALYTGSPAAFAAWTALSPAEQQQRQVQGIAAWKQWMADNAASVAETGGPLSKTTLIDLAGISEIRNQLAGFTIVQAESQQAAAALFVNHPHFAIFPGQGVELMEFLPIPA